MAAEAEATREARAKVYTYFMLYIHVDYNNIKQLFNNWHTGVKFIMEGDVSQVY